MTKGKHLIETGLQFKGYQHGLLSAWWEAWQHTSRHGAGEGAESCILIQMEPEENSLLQAASRRVSSTLHLA